ncbi:MAG TPA: hypothetical protein VN083_07225 [Vicinamibacteria bacterium]|jgi:hypothetical protein|nr:hypothetical protein [Vicinamibacteria bacterium]
MDHCPVCLNEASCDTMQQSELVHSVSCPACGSLVLTLGAMAFLSQHTVDDPRRGEYSTVLRLVQRSDDRPIDDTTLKMWSDWLHVSGPEAIAQVLTPHPPSLRDS